uniref:Uncharacterized protein n=1 Tax=Cacopsylla melanoneura TaxID=428564 RepID=A0A8D8UD24_9HEMI
MFFVKEQVRFTEFDHPPIFIVGINAWYGNQIYFRKGKLAFEIRFQEGQTFWSHVCCEISLIHLILCGPNLEWNTARFALFVGEIRDVETYHISGHFWALFERIQCPVCLV